MEEDQALWILRGSLASPREEWRLRAGRAHYSLRRGVLQQRAKSRSIDPAIRVQCEVLRDAAKQKLARFAPAHAQVRVQALVRHRRVGDQCNPFGGFWGWVQVPGQPKSYFGGNQQVLKFRRGPWESWPVPDRAELNVNTNLPLIFSPYCGTLLHEALGHAMEADYLKTSPFEAGFGKRWSCEELTVMDRPDLADLPGSMATDDCGQPASATTMLHRGFLVGDLGWGRGVLRRGTYRDLPMVRATNFVIKAGSAEPRSWIHNLPNSYYVSWIRTGAWQMGTSSISVVTGPIYELRKGQVVAAAPLSRLTFDMTLMLKRLTAVGSDFEIDPLVHWCMKRNQAVPISMASPSLLLEGL